ncbi:MAG TPA: alpha/beta hydrolase-fold protein [Kofleriaceae bacterium]|nr:alpha/beta hydrolase-fold protein [Kofleriaceae bacterium]
MPKPTRRRAATHLGPLLALVLSPAACDGGPDGAVADGGTADAAPRGPDAGPAGACPPGGTGLACLFDLYDEARSGCDSDRLAELGASLAARHGDLPAWITTEAGGRALFVTMGAPAAVAGDFNQWSSTALVTAPLCGGPIHAAEAAIPTGSYRYKLFANDLWKLDPGNWAFAFDDFGGNPDGRNSVLNTYDSGRGHLVQPDQDVCSLELGNCRRFHTYLPPGYGAPEAGERRYPALFMHDGQNIFDDTDCCFGHTGWEVNRQLDADIASGEIEPVVVIGFPHAGAARTDEYGFSSAAGGLQETFMAFQVGTVQPRAAALWRLDAQRYYVAGSSLGGLLSARLAFAYPQVYAGAASLSGSFWVGQDTNTAMSDFAAQTGKISMALYQDHGGTAQTGSDNYPDNVALRDQLVGLGWRRGDSPSCTRGPDALCYFHDVGATHDELAWQARSYRFLRFFFTN